jgi:hypothetical protein
MWLTKCLFQPADIVNPCPQEIFVFFFSFLLEENEKKKKLSFYSPAIFRQKIAFTTISEGNGSSLKESILYKNKQKSCQLRQSLVSLRFDGVPRVEGR